MSLVRLTVVACVLLAGCGLAPGADPAVGTGSRATLGDDALAATEFERAGDDSLPFETTLHASLSGDVQVEATRPVDVTVPVSRYVRRTDAGAAVVALASAPAVRPVENVPSYRDPLSTLSVAERVNLLQETYVVEDLARTAQWNATLLGNETTVTVYETDADGDAGSPLVAVASVRHREDYVTAVLVAPTDAVSGFDVLVRRLLDGVEH